MSLFGQYVAGLGLRLSSEYFSRIIRLEIVTYNDARVNFRARDHVEARTYCGHGPMAPSRINDTFVRRLRAPTKGNVIAYDSEVPGFGVRVTANGAKSFVLNYRIKGRERRYTIGRFPAWGAAAARNTAEELRRDIDKSIDPLARRQDARAAPTVNDLYTRYDQEHLPKKATRAADDDRSMWKTYVLPSLGNVKVADVTHTDIDALHRRISKGKPVRANRVIEVVRKGFSLAIRWGWRTDNPATGVVRNPEERRQRYLNNDERKALLAAMEKHPEKTSINAIRLMMLTGCRRGEALMATWDQFDLKNGVWTKPSTHTKQRKEHRVPLSKAVLDLLRPLKDAAKGKFVFPGKEDAPLTDVKRTWAMLRTKAGIPDARLHDLRHTVASTLVSSGHSLPVIGALLGHTQPATTHRYAHLYDHTLREAAEKVSAIATSADEAPDDTSAK